MLPKKCKTFLQKKQDLSWPKKYERRIADNAKFVVPENIFTRIDDEKITAMVEKYVKK